MGKNTGTSKVLIASVVMLMIFGTVFMAVQLTGVNPFYRAPTTTTEGKQVQFTVNVLYEQGGGAVGSGTVYILDTANEPLASATISSGSADFTTTGLEEGQQIEIQARAAAPSSSGYIFYTTPLTTYTVPVGSGANNVASITIKVWKVMPHVITFSARDNGNNAISDQSTNYINTTDTSIDVTVSLNVADSNAVYGTPAAFTDSVTGHSYAEGYWVLFSFSASQPLLKGYTVTWSTLSATYYAIHIEPLEADASGTTVGTTTASLKLSDPTGTNFAAATTVTIDVFDTVQLETGQTTPTNAGLFMNGDSDLNPTAITTKIA